mgnify:CR=1 FL=1
MRVMVTGSRHWWDKERIFYDLLSLPKDSIVIHGGAQGADSIADEIAKTLGLEVEVFPADWENLGRAAGPIRNRTMIDTMPERVYAYLILPSKGTAHAIKYAKLAGLDVRIREGNLNAYPA